MSASSTFSPAREPLPDLLKQFIEATGESSSRVRAAAVLAVVASVTLLAGSLHVGTPNWYYKRVAEVDHDAETLLRMPAATLPLNFDPKELNQYRQAIFKQMYSNHVVNVPVFGVAVHVEDLGMLGGAFLVVIAFMLRYSIERHLVNCRILFARGRALGRLKDCYDLLAMQQVLTVPLAEEDDRLRNRSPFSISILRHLPKLLFMPPALVMAFEARQSWLTAVDVIELTGSLVWIRHMVTVAWLAIVTALVVGALRRSRDIDAEWDRVAGELAHPRPTLVDDLRSLLAPQPSGTGPIRIEAWATWATPQQDAYLRLATEAGTTLAPATSAPEC